MKRKTLADVITDGDLEELITMHELASRNSPEDFQMLLETLYQYESRPAFYNKCLIAIERGINHGDAATRVEKTDLLDKFRFFQDLKNDAATTTGKETLPVALTREQTLAPKEDSLSGTFISAAIAAAEGQQRLCASQYMYDHSQLKKVVDALKNLPRDEDGERFVILMCGPVERRRLSIDYSLNELEFDIYNENDIKFSRGSRYDQNRDNGVCENLDKALEILAEFIGKVAPSRLAELDKMTKPKKKGLERIGFRRGSYGVGPLGH